MSDYIVNLSQATSEIIEVMGKVSSKAQEWLNKQSTIEVYGLNRMTDSRQPTRRIEASNERDAKLLRDKPTFARIDTVTENGNYFKTFYISPAPVVGLPGHGCFATVRAPLGRIASLDIGDEFSFEGTEIYISHKVTYRPWRDDFQNWDGEAVEIVNEENEIISIDLLSKLLEVKSEEIYDYLKKLQEFASSKEGQLKSLQYSLRNEVSLQNQNILDKSQDEIYRLPITTQIILLGPPGTGKTTTLIKRLALKMSNNFENFNVEEQNILKKLNKNIEDVTGFNKWIMFTPSKLLLSYLKKAFGDNGIPVENRNIEFVRTWEDFSREIARDDFSILNTADKKSAFVLLRNNTEIVRDGVIDNPIIWVNSFNTYLDETLNKDLESAFDLIDKVENKENIISSELINKLFEISASNKDLLSKYREIWQLDKDIKAILGKLVKRSDEIIREESNLIFNQDSSFEINFSLFLQQLRIDELDEDAEYDLDEDESVLNRSDIAIELKKFFRGYARILITKKKLKADSKIAKIADFLGDRLPLKNRLEELGKNAVLQNALRRYQNSWKSYYRNIVKYYKKFRVNRLDFYCNEKPDEKRISISEKDFLLFCSLKRIQKLLNDTYISCNLENFPDLKLKKDRIFREQVAVDEATDFTVLQLACMNTLVLSDTNSFLACGDFNQRLENTGIKNLELFEWINPKIKIKRINTIYRQTPALNKFACHLLDNMQDGDKMARAQLPSHIDFSGVPPILKESSYDLASTCEWLKDRIGDIERLINEGQADKRRLTIVILVENDNLVNEVTHELNNYLDEIGLEAEACTEGRVIGNSRNVRVCSIEYIKGLEFDAVFFLDIDILQEKFPILYQKYLYVGATRAATFLGVTCKARLPIEMESMREEFVETWNLELLNQVIT